jgi:predicted  nucleic acid-binding Zn-ribbon protein
MWIHEPGRLPRGLQVADRTPGGQAVDKRALLIRRRQIEHEIKALDNTIFKLETDILQAEQGIERTKESIEATHERVVEKKDLLDTMMVSEEKSDG